MKKMMALLAVAALPIASITGVGFATAPAVGPASISASDSVGAALNLQNDDTSGDDIVDCGDDSLVGASVANTPDIPQYQSGPVDLDFSSTDPSGTINLCRDETSTHSYGDFGTLQITTLSQQAYQVPWTSNDITVQVQFCYDPNGMPFDPQFVDGEILEFPNGTMTSPVDYGPTSLPLRPQIGYPEPVGGLDAGNASWSYLPIENNTSEPLTILNNATGSEFYWEYELPVTLAPGQTILLADKIGRWTTTIRNIRVRTQAAPRSTPPLTKTCISRATTSPTRSISMEWRLRQARTTIHAMTARLSQW